MGASVDADAVGRVDSLHRSDVHAFSKPRHEELQLVAGVGVEGDAHAGPTVQHRSRVAADASQPNLRQVHLLHGELHDELRALGLGTEPGEIGENVTTRGLDLLAFPTGTTLRIGDVATVVLTGLRNPCRQLDDLRPGLLAAVLDRAADGTLVRKAGVMAVVVLGGAIRVGDPVLARFPPGTPVPLRPV